MSQNNGPPKSHLEMTINCGWKPVDVRVALTHHRNIVKSGLLADSVEGMGFLVHVPSGEGMAVW